MAFEWFKTHHIEIIQALSLILFNIFLFNKIKRKIIDKLFFFSQRTNQTETLRKALMSALNYAIVIVDILVIFILWGNELPNNLLAVSGFLGLAIGVGAQSLVKDVLTGLFLIIERQLEVGDFVQINDGIEGIVEEVGLRISKVREFNQRLHYLPNRTIEHVTNYNRENMRQIIHITVPFEVDVEHALQILRKVAEHIQDAHHQHVKEEPTVLGVTDIHELGAQLTISVATTPSEYWRMGREIRKEILIAFREDGVNLAIRALLVGQNRGKV